MTLQQMNYALTIAEYGSVNKAAEKLFLTQPSITNALKDLEAEIGIRIFHRTNKGMVVTSEGQEFLAYARQIQLQYEMLTDRYGKNGIRKGKFAISTQHYSFAVKAFVEMVKQFDIAEYDLAIRETKTIHVIEDVGNSRSELGILYMSEYNQKVIQKLLNERELVFHELISCNAYAYMQKDHPLADRESVTLEDLAQYPCLSFEQGSMESAYFAEEILSENEYARMIKVSDRATLLNLMVGLNGYTLCSGIICSELNGSGYVAVPFASEGENCNAIMHIGYIMKKHAILSKIGEVYLQEIKRYLSGEEGVK